MAENAKHAVDGKGTIIRGPQVAPVVPSPSEFRAERNQFSFNCFCNGHQESPLPRIGFLAERQDYSNLAELRNRRATNLVANAQKARVFRQEIATSTIIHCAG